MSAQQIDSPRSRCILILGMHRSGTSAATRCLNLLGMDVGSALLSPDNRNSKGYWEHADAVRINHELLQALGLSWWSLAPLPENWMDSPAALEARRAIEQVVRRDFAGVPLWGLKDPRMCRTAPLWIDVIRGMGIAVDAVFVARSPSEVALSLEKAHALSRGAGVLLWMQHLVESERATRGLPRVMITYDQLLADPVGTLETISHALGFAWTPSPVDRSEALHAFLDTTLRTHARSVDVDNLPMLAHELDQASRDAAGGRGWGRLLQCSDQASDVLQWLEYRGQANLPDEVFAQHALSRMEQDRHVASLYWASGDEAFGEERVLTVPLSHGRNQVEFPLTMAPDARYRLDPSSQRGYFALHAMVLLDASGCVIWDGKIEVAGTRWVQLEPVARPSAPGQVLYVAGDDPQILFDWSKALVADASVLRIDLDILTADRIGDELDAARASVVEKDELLRQETEARHQGNAAHAEALVLAERAMRDALSAERAASQEALHIERHGMMQTLHQRAEDLRRRDEDLQQRLAHQSTVIDGLRQGQIRQDEALRALLRNGLWARLRRRLARTEFRLLPRQHLEVVDPIARRYRVTGNDPIFDCDSENYPLASGWYRITLEMEQHGPLPVQACLYLDYGPDILFDPAGVGMPFVRPGHTVHHGLVRFSSPLRGLRFDPAVMPCELSVSRMVIQRISKLHAGGVLFNAWRRPLEAVGKARPAWRSILHTFRTQGLSGMIGQLYNWYTTVNAQNQNYDVWLQSFDITSPELLRSARARVAGWAYQPRISVLVPTYNTDEKWLRRCIDSVLEQAYPNWELCVADDASPKAHVIKVLEEYAARDARIHVQRRSANGHISASSNTALGMASGDYIALLDHDDELHPMALYEVVRALQTHRQWKLVYTDEDKIDQHGHRYDPYMKPDWNYDLLLSQNCISHLGIYQRDLLTRIGGFRAGFEGSQDWDLALRCIEQLQPDEIGHIAKVLYHWRAIPGSTSMGVDEKGYARTAAHKAINEHLMRMGAAASAEEIEGRPGNFRVQYRLPERVPKISLVIPTRDGLHLLKRCIDSIITLTDYPDYEIVIVDNQSQEPDTHSYFEAVVKEPRVRVLAYDKPFNYSAINNYAVSVTDGALVGLVNNDIEVISSGWLTEMASHAMRPDIGAVGAMLYYPDDTIQHAGVVLGVHGVAAHSYCGEPRGFPGQMGRARLVQELSAVTAACLLVRREVFDAVGGLDESLRVAFNDIDFCLRVRGAGYRNLWTPFAELYHHESATRGYEDSPEKRRRFQGEVDYMMAEWSAALAHDPAYNPNLTLTGTPNELAFPPRVDAWDVTS